MKQFFQKIGMLCLILLFGCTTQDGSLSINKEKGILYIILENSDESAIVYINNMPTKYTTPNNFEVLPGEYSIKVIMPGYQSNHDSINLIITENQLEEVRFDIIAVASGRLKINSNITNISIMIDGLLYNNNNVIIDGLEKGNHPVICSKPGYYNKKFDINIAQNTTTILDVNLEKKSEIFLIEHFSNVSCDPCVERDEDLETYIADHDTIEFISIGYHPDFPSESDPMFLAARDENLARKNFYGVNKTPSVFINGTTIPTFSKKHIVMGLDKYISENSQNIGLNNFSITIDNPVNKIEGRVKFESIDIDRNVTLRIVLIEKEIVFDEAPGTNGMIHFKNIIRKMYPDHSGSAVMLQKNRKDEYVFSFVQNSIWENDLQVIAYFQDDDTKEIIAATASVIF